MKFLLSFVLLFSSVIYAEVIDNFSNFVIVYLKCYNNGDIIYEDNNFTFNGYPAPFILDYNNKKYKLIINPINKVGLYCETTNK